MTQVPGCCTAAKKEKLREKYECEVMHVPFILPSSTLVAMSVFDLDMGDGFTEEVWNTSSEAQPRLPVVGRLILLAYNYCLLVYWSICLQLFVR